MNRTLALFWSLCCASLVACGDGGTHHCSAPELEEQGIAWGRLSGQVAYARWENDFPPPESHGCIFLIDVAARRVRVIRDANLPSTPMYGTVGWAGSLAFRNDRTTLTFDAQNVEDRWEIRDLSLATGTETLLYSDPSAHLAYPAWSRDGRLAYYSNGVASADIVIDGTPAVPYANRSRVAWLNTDSLVASIADADSAGTLYVVDISKQWQTKIIGGWAASPAAGTNGKLAYVHADATGESIWIADGDGANQKQITTGPSDHDPAWSADGGSVLFVRSGQGLFLVDLAASSTTRVTERPVDAVAWAP